MGKKEKEEVKKEKAVVLSCDYEIHHIGVLDGIRALAVLVVVWFHFWQQSWIMPHIGDVSLDWIPRTGYLMVDMMIFMSGFCLFLPYARKMVYGERAQSVSEFYVKRAARILPSYYIAVAVALIFALAMGAYASNQNMLKDLFAHIFLVHNFFPETYVMTQLNGVLWTVAVEAQFYLFFPLYAKAFQKKPILTYLGMIAIGLSSSYLIGQNFDTINQSLYVNHVLTFASVYANGLLAAWLYMVITKNRKRKTVEGVAGMVTACACVYVYYLLTTQLQASDNGQKWQVENRFLLSLLFMVFVLAVIFSARWFRKIFDNRIMVFLAGISYNLYIWHQYIAVKLKEFRIPFWEGDTPPNQSGDTVWQWQYMILCIILSLLVATAMTYLVERPLAKKILALYRKHRVK
ncbi:MAG: acyltransferase [Eubacterium sp.]|nr:acyltransferase [Eubacterium sp.]